MDRKRDMSCTSPMVLNLDSIDKYGNKHWKFLGKARELDLHDPSKKIVPCGNCINCRLKKSREWADRIMIESWFHEQSWFVTLTYNDFWLPTVYYPEENTGEMLPAYTLFKRDWQLFMKRLRKSLDYPIRFYMAGEYGDKTCRPHYHAIIFGLKLDEDDLYNERRGKSGFSLWQSKTIEKAWSKELFGRSWPVGHVMVAPCNWQTAAYVSRYVTKKLKGEAASFYSECNLEPPFSLMSRGRNPLKPGDPDYRKVPCGIGRDLYLSDPECVRDKRKLFIPTDKGSKQIMMPKYFDRFLEFDFPDEFAIIKEDRSFIAGTKAYCRPDTDLEFEDYNELRNVESMNRLKKLIREEV